MLGPRLEDRIKACGVFVLYALWKTRLKGQEFVVPVPQEAWGHVASLYARWEGGVDGPAGAAGRHADALRALQQLIANGVLQWHAVHPSLQRSTLPTQTRLWTPAYETGDVAATQPTAASRVLSDSALASLHVLEQEYTAAKQHVVEAGGAGEETLARCDGKLVQRLQRTKALFLTHRDTRLTKVSRICVCECVCV